jgi:hypothetical protein
LAGSPTTNGTALGTATTANTWVSQSQLSITGATTTTTLKAGDIITISGIYEVHPELRTNTGRLRRFVVQGDVTATNGATFNVKPGLIYGSGNAFQNCVLSIDVSQFGAWGSRATQDGIRLRIARQYDITNDKIPCRLDILWGCAELYPELASVHRYESDLV